MWKCWRLWWCWLHGIRDVRGFGYRCTVLCAEGYSTYSSTSEASSSFVVECAESVSLFNLQACQPVQCNAMPPMKYINPMIQVEYLFGQNVAFQFLDGYSVDGAASGDTSFSASCSSNVSWTLSDCGPITCGSFSSPANDITSPTSAFVDGVVHVSCDSGHSLTQTSYVHEIAYTCTSSGSYVVSASQGVEISNTPTCYPVSCGVPPSVLNAIVDRTTAVTTWSSSDDCTDSAAPLCSNLQCVAISCSGGSFVPDGLYDSSCDSVTPMTGKYATNYFSYKSDVGCVCMLKDWISSSDEICAYN